MRRKKKLSIVAATAALLVAGLTAVGVAAQLDQGYVGTAPAPGDQAENVSLEAAVDATAVADRIAILRRAPTVADQVPDDIARSPLFLDNPVSLAAARRVGGVERAAWIAPSTSGDAICYFAAGELSCPPAKAIAADGVAVGAMWHVDTPVRIVGVASDAVRSITVVARDGSERRVDVVDSYLEFETEHMPSEARWNGPNGPETLSFPNIDR